MYRFELRCPRTAQRALTLHQSRTLRKLTFGSYEVSGMLHNVIRVNAYVRVDTDLPYTDVGKAV